MTGKQHLLFGLSTAAAFTLAGYEKDILILDSIPIFIEGVFLGSLIPDIDNPKSILGNLFYPISFLINKLIGHRTYTHDPILWIPLAIVLTIKYPLLFGFFWGYIGHIFLDSLTTKGIPVAYFFHKKSFKLPKYLSCNSNSKAAMIVTIVMSLFVISIIRFIPIS